jgi:hypothetical protein
MQKTSPFPAGLNCSEPEGSSSCTQAQRALMSRFARVSVDDFNDAVRARIDQHGMLVHVSVAVTRHVVIGRNVVVGDPAFRQHGAHAEFIVIAIGRQPLVHDIFVEAWTLFYAKNTTDGADGGTDCAPDDRADRTRIAGTLGRAFLRPANGGIPTAWGWTE